MNYTEKQTRKKWLQKAKGQFGWNILALVVGILPLPLFLLNFDISYLAGLAALDFVSSDQSLA